MASHLRLFGRKLAVATIAAVGLAVGATTVSANDTIDVTIDFAKMLRLDGEAGTVVIGNPSIADASISDEKTLVLTGKTAGTTNLIVINSDGEEIVNTTLRVSSDIRKLTTVFYGAQRQTFSCSPVCEQVISVGDDPAKFSSATEQIQTRRQFLTGQ